MARMITNSSLYFPLDVGWFDDIKVRRLEDASGHTGLQAYLIILSRVYSDKRGYCTDKEKNLIFDISQRLKVSEEEVERIIDFAFEVGLFDKGVCEKYGVITAASVQRRFQEMVKKKAARRHICVDERFWLLGKETKPFIDIVCEDGTVLGPTKEKKEKKIKENKIKEKKTKEADLKSADDTAAPIIAEYEECIGKATETVISGIRDFLDRGMKGDLLIRLIRYAAEQNKCSWQYVSAAAEGNIADGILTLNAYNGRHFRSSYPKRKKGINNYVDTNKPDYSDFGEQIIREMLEEAEALDQKGEKGNE